MKVRRFSRILRPAWIFFFFVAFGESLAVSTSCPDLYETVAFKDLELRPVVISDLDEAYDSCQIGLVPNLDDPTQRNAFVAYVLNRLGDPTIEVPADTLDQLTEALKRHPHLGKEAFPVVQLDKNRTVRNLSFTEAPFRSCLGRDCSSRTYLTKAFQENIEDMNGRPFDEG